MPAPGIESQTRRERRASSHEATLHVASVAFLSGTENVRVATNASINDPSLVCNCGVVECQGMIFSGGGREVRCLFS